VCMILDGLRRRRLGEMTGAIAARYHVTETELTGTVRTQQVVRARHALWAEMKALGFSWSEMGRIFQRDHSSIFYGVRNHHKRLGENDVCAT
jgi:chromosomal replication initiation ATPase DnaA